MVGPTAEEPSNDVRDLRDGEDEGVSTSVGPGVQGGGALLGKVGRAEIGWDQAQNLVNIISAEK